DDIKDQHENALASKVAENLQKTEVLSGPEYTEDEFKDEHENALASNAAEGLQKMEVVSSPEYKEGPSDHKKRKTQKDEEQNQTNSSKILEPIGDQKRRLSSDDVSAVEKTKRRKTDTSTNVGTSKETASASPVEDSQLKRIDASVLTKIVQVMKGESIMDNSLRIWDYGGQLIYHSIHR
ncbi:uncharacterized protein LOC117110376, partial [Anneissia japonica]|uniref:uncharacterized protein LOC117110376 n=1 Tax=Anneissia japonica TaxID=1529436 RepID=UPI001425787B